MNDKWFAFSQSNDEATVEITTGIGGWFGIDPNEFIEELNGISAKVLILKICSGGGSVFAGNQIFNALTEWRNQNQAVIIARVSSIAASMASILAMAADEVHIYRNSFIMIHEAATESWGNASDLSRDADLLSKINENAVAAYKQHSTLDADVIRQLMTDETWIDAATAIEWGFAQQIIDEDAAPVQVTDKAMAQRAPAEACMVMILAEEDVEVEVEKGGEDNAIIEPEVEVEEDESDVKVDEPADNEVEPEPTPEPVQRKDDVVYDEGFHAGSESKRLELEQIISGHADEVAKLTAAHVDELDSLRTLAVDLEAKHEAALAELFDKNVELERRLSTLLPALGGADDTNTGSKTWAEAVKECGSYADARNTYPALYEEIRAAQKAARNK